MPLVPAEKALKPTAYCSTAAINDLLNGSQEELGENGKKCTLQ